MRDTMIFYRSFYDAIKNLSQADQCEIYNAIFSYGLNFEEPELIGVPASFWTLIKPQIDANIKRFENGKKPKTKQTESKTEANKKQTQSKSGTNNNNNNNNNIHVYRSFGHLSISLDEFNKLFQIYSKEKIDCILDEIENNANNKKYKSLYLTAKTWLKRNEPEPETKIVDPLVEYVHKQMGIK